MDFPIKVRTCYYKDNNCILINDDSFIVLKDSTKSIDMIFADPILLIK